MYRTIKIISGWSKPGGSTCHHIWLTNTLNEQGYDCTFYGPHDWHLDKCKSGKIGDGVSIHPNDAVVGHFIPADAITKVQSRRRIYSCHESPALSPVRDMNLDGIDVVHFVSEHQRRAQGVEHEQVIIPPHVEKISWTAPGNKKAAVIGSIDSNKHPRQAIENAMKDGFERILLFGKVNDTKYFTNHILPYVAVGAVEIRQHEDDREKMYNQVDAVYHASHSETYGLVEAECKASGIPYNGAEFLPEPMEDKEIIQKWKDILEL